ncbi:MAG: diaminopimelate epimerase [Pseudomonadota bacterium]
MILDFVKMHGLGNDFVLLDGVSTKFTLNENQISKLAHRKFGIGCDQLLIAEETDTENVDFRYRIFNSDGSEAEQCGNGARCFAQFVKRQGLTHKDCIRVETLAGVFTLIIRDRINVTVEMGAPIFDAAKIPFVSQTNTNTHYVDNENQHIEFSVVSMGNPHAVIFVDDIKQTNVQQIGTQMEVDPRFPNRTNVQFVQVMDRGNIAQRIFERGGGETLASGSGACAAVAVAQKQNQVDDNVCVHMPGGELEIHSQKNNTCLFMTGPTEYSFEGRVEV